MRQSVRSCFLTMFVSVCFVSAGCYAADLDRGRALHDEDCLVCHDSSVYTRENRRIQTLEELMARVEMCQQDVGAEWDDNQFDAVVSYLNSAFYKFEKTAPALR